VLSGDLEVWDGQGRLKKERIYIYIYIYSTATREQPPLSTTREKPAGSNEDPVQPKS